MIPEASRIDYHAAAIEWPGNLYSDGEPFLNRMSELWVSSYRRQSARKTNITEMWFNGFSALVDLEGSDHGDGRGPQPPGVFPRTIAAYGLSKPSDRSRNFDDQRLRQLEPTAVELRQGRDRGHFIAHSIGGAVIAAETNVFSQRRDLNRGWSVAGKVFREMERYAARHPGTPIFHRAIYLSESDLPALLEVGLVRVDSTLWIECFDNHDAA